MLRISFETLILQVFHFLLLVFILNYLMFRPIMRVVNKRAKYIEEKKRQVDNLEEETKRLIDKCVSMESNARREAGEDSLQLKREADEVAENMLRDTREEVDMIRVEAAKEVDKKIKEAQPFLQRGAAILAEELIEKVIGRRFAN